MASTDWHPHDLSGIWQDLRPSIDGHAFYRWSDKDDRLTIQPMGAFWCTTSGKVVLEDSGAAGQLRPDATYTATVAPNGDVLAIQFIRCNGGTWQQASEMLGSVLPKDEDYLTSAPNLTTFHRIGATAAVAQLVAAAPTPNAKLGFYTYIPTPTPVRLVAAANQMDAVLGPLPPPTVWPRRKLSANGGSEKGPEYHYSASVPMGWALDPPGANQGWGWVARANAPLDVPGHWIILIDLGQTPFGPTGNFMRSLKDLPPSAARKVETQEGPGWQGTIVTDNKPIGHHIDNALPYAWAELVADAGQWQITVGLMYCRGLQSRPGVTPFCEDTTIEPAKLPLATQAFLDVVRSVRRGD